jgi:hypothetical protein
VENNKKKVLPEENMHKTGKSSMLEIKYLNIRRGFRWKSSLILILVGYQMMDNYLLKVKLEIQDESHAVT